MEMVLTGNQITAQEAFNYGLVSKLFPPEQLVEEAIKLGEKIGQNSKLTVAICKASVNNGKLEFIWAYVNLTTTFFSITAYETTLKQGLESEKRLFHTTFGTVSFCL